MNFLRERAISQPALDLIQFDSDSIRQIAQGLHTPDVWLADPDAYEKNGRVFRDSDSPRMLAYSTKDHILYATDGCNACSRRVSITLEALPSTDLKPFAEENGIPLELAERLVALVSRNGR